MSVQVTNNIPTALNDLKTVKETALYALGEFLKTEAQSRTPVDTGLLISRNAYIVDKEKSKLIIGNDVEYAIDVEKGTSKQKAQPFIEPAVRDNILPIQNIVKAEMKRGGF